MHRLFIAIRPPGVIREALLALRTGLPGARWQDDDQLHLTLRFIGEVGRHEAEDVAHALDSVHAPPPTVHIRGVGSFGRKGRVDTLWAGVDPVQALLALHRKLDQALVRTGLEPERRAFKPHMTLARFGRAGGSVEGFLAAHAGLDLTGFEPADFRLYESRLGADGAHYEAVRRYPFAASARGPV